MFRQMTAVSLFVLCFVGWQVSYAASPVDAKLKAAQYDLDRAEQQAVGLTKRNASKLRRVRQSLDNARAQLGASADQSSVAWKHASQRLAKLEQLVAKLTSSQQPLSSPTSKQVRKSRPAPAAAQAAPASGGLTAYDQAQLATVNRQTESLIARVQQVDPKDFAVARVVTQWRNDTQRMKDLFMKITLPNHPNAQPIAQKIIALGAFVEQQAAKASEAEAALGDVKSRVEAIAARVRVKMPSRPDKPFTAEKVQLYAQQLNGLSATAKKDHAWLQSVNGKTRMVAQSVIDSQLAATGEHRQQYIAREAGILADELKQQFPGADFFAETASKSKIQHIERNMNALYDASNLLAVVDAFEKTTGMEIMDTATKRATYQQAIAVLADRSVEAIAERRFPPERSKDAALLAAAKQVLSKHKVNPIEHMAITYDKQRKSVKEGDIDWGRVVTTITVTGYEWDEFAVTTAEKIGGKHYLYYNLFKFFHKGGTDVPTGKWTLAERRKNAQILVENIKPR